MQFYADKIKYEEEDGEKNINEQISKLAKSSSSAVNFEIFPFAPEMLNPKFLCSAYFLTKSKTGVREREGQDKRKDRKKKSE